MRKMFVVFSVLVVASMLITACGTTATPAATSAPASAATSAPAATQAPAGPTFKSKDPTTFTEVSFGDPDTLDPALDYETAGASVIQNTYDSLLFYDGSQPGKFTPNLASSWTISSDGKDYVFTLQSGVKFHNGDAMTASDAAYTFQRGLLQGGTASPQWLLYEAFFGTGVSDIADVVEFANAAKDPTAIDVSKGPLDTSKITGSLEDDNATLSKSDPAILKAVCERVQSQIVADDSANTVTFHLIQPWGPLMANMAQTWAAVMDQKWVASNGGWDGSCDTWQKWYGISSADDPLTKLENGTGPFKLDHWTPGQEIVLTRNDAYWRTTPAYDGGPSGPAALKTVNIKNVNEWGTRFSMLQAGDADLVVVPPENRAQVDPMVGQISVYDNSSGSFGPLQDVCGYDASQTGAAKWKVCASGETPNGQPLALFIGQPGLLRTDVFMNFNISDSDNANPYIGSGKLDGNGIPPDFFSDINIRQAFNYCFDWDTFNNDVFQGEAVQSTAIPLPGMPGYSDNAPHYTFDLDKCKAAFQASTWKSADGKSLWDVGFRMSAVYNQGNTTRQKVAEILAANIGSVNDKFLIDTVGLPWPSFLAAQRAKTLPMFISGWLEDIHDPHDWYVPYLIGTYGLRQNLPADLQAKFKDLINQGVGLSDPSARDAVYQQLNQAVYDAAPDIILSFATGHGYQQRWVHGLVRNPIFPDIYFYGITKD
ncbi:MAG TPA: ABC transporter substrate-binding protein [Anaerolineales bacterium]|nr:ABC transporter substrate-binding protein [Anaerolineales bacterium]